MKRSRTVESVGDPLGTKLLTFVLSVIAGSVDVIGFLGLGTLFIAHVTGNLVILAARAAAGEHAPAAHLLSVPVFIIALVAARLLAARLDRSGIATLRPLLLLQFLLLSGFLAICIGVGSLGRSERGDHDSCCHAWRFRDGCTKRSCANLAQGRAVHCGDDDQLDSVCSWILVRCGSEGTPVAAPRQWRERGAPE